MDAPKKSLKHAMRLLRLLDYHPPILQQADHVFVSIHLNVSKVERDAMLKDKHHVPVVDELGIAILDSTNIFSPSRTTVYEGRRRIDTHYYSVRRPKGESDCEDLDGGSLGECVFVKTAQIRQADVVPTVERALHYAASDSDLAHLGPSKLRPVMLVGHSIKGTIKILRGLGLDISSCPVRALFDTRSLSRKILLSSSDSLALLLYRMKCPYEEVELQNAGNYATYTLLATLLLAVVWAGQRNLRQPSQDNRTIIETFLAREIKVPRRAQAMKARQELLEGNTKSPRNSHVQDNDVLAARAREGCSCMYIIRQHQGSD